MLAPIFIHQISPVTVNRRGYIKATQGSGVNFDFDLVGEPKLPRRTLFSLVAKDLAESISLFDIGATPEISFTKLKELGNDRYSICATPSECGFLSGVVIAWTDEVDRLCDLARRKRAIGDSYDLELADIAWLLDRQLDNQELLVWPTGLDQIDSDPKFLVEQRTLQSRYLISNLMNLEIDASLRLDLVDFQAIAPYVHMPSRIELATLYVGPSLRCERPKAGFSNWYELFPRSVGGLSGVVDLLPRIAKLGFDTLYLPPIHPIGVTNRKGKNNTLVAEIDDVGSPWAIGYHEGGHSAIEPSLGDFGDFEKLITVARELGIEVALDIALQASPDHPWVKEHPEWFSIRSNNEIAYAENPPKKYQDIYPINFFSFDANHAIELWSEVYSIFEFWISKGVHIFRVDNPHTKPLPFWEYICDRLMCEHPEVILLAEAFTMPKLMYRLGEIGYSQSYTYFTWRITKDELISYGNELAASDVAATLRSNFWPNTPDILGDVVRFGNRAAFRLRATLAAMMGTSWGIYSGYEFCENTPFSIESEEYLDSEKYQIRRRDYQHEAVLDFDITNLNIFRRRHFMALSNQAGFRELPCDNGSIVSFLRYDAELKDLFIVVCNLDTHSPSEGQIELWPIRQLLGISKEIVTHDHLSGETYSWSGDRAFVRLDPMANVAHLLDIEM
ncbi:alpha-amylase family glycosyl hydrolase [Acidithrix ferrooxidans]|uniref:Alpha-1,4-glucan:maltose-1-phosphate maltosyltransferase 1 n=1 Tax=Acidithrix ferrooxidans TaxID=1280514 RepID=A0A0D8HIW2_9ACTN|nr:maltotransferase domain-containing protein [Acidithrix ferrooxidans]KJF17868.1 alpha-1,4-glucan:maltose-1-phosphate maltosyltransferase 1 [Acidithrix ferrooxidans]